MELIHSIDLWSVAKLTPARMVMNGAIMPPVKRLFAIGMMINLYLESAEVPDPSDAIDIRIISWRSCSKYKFTKYHTRPDIRRDS